jgi:Ca2+-binding EF-hand superfamily protein
MLLTGITLPAILILTSLIACGYYLDDKRITQLNEFLDEKKASKIDLNTLLLVLTQLKELELMNEQENESDEYCKSDYVDNLSIVDAFVALGGQPTKEGYISKNTLIEIIKTEFELTIDMEVNSYY